MWAMVRIFIFSGVAALLSLSGLTFLTWQFWVVMLAMVVVQVSVVLER